MKITALVENTSCRADVEAEHGLSLYIETENAKILFDMGQTDLACRNAERLGIDLASVDFAILSHGHYDHGGGFWAFRRINPSAPVFVSPHAFGQFYSTKYIGLDPAIKSDGNLVLVDKDICPKEGICILNGNKVPLEAWQNKGLCKMEKGERLPDDFAHEIYLMVRENDKTVLFCGCSHRGVLSISRHFAPDVLVGGFHFKNLCPEREHDRAFLQKAAQTLSQNDTVYYTCHCTGKEPFAFLKEQMPGKLYYLSCGESVTI